MKTKRKKALSLLLVTLAGLLLVVLAILSLTACNGKPRSKTYKVGFLTEGLVRKDIDSSIMLGKVAGVVCYLTTTWSKGKALPLHRSGKGPLLISQMLNGPMPSPDSSQSRR